MAVCEITPLPDTLTFEVTACFKPRMVNVDGDIYACVYQGPNEDGWLVTFSVDPAGNISEILDKFEFDGAYADAPDIARVGTGVIAIVWRDTYGYGGIETYEIDADGIINRTPVDYYMFETGTFRNGNIRHTGIGNVWIIAYEDASVRGWVKTLTIDRSGNITHEVIDSLMFDGGNGGQPITKDILLNVFAVFYIGPLYDVKVSTFRIEDNGQLGDAIIDSFVFEVGGDHQVDFWTIGTAMIACVYRSDASHGHLKTIGCDFDGFFNENITDSYHFPDANFAYPSIEKIGAECYAITFQGVEEDGWIKTITITHAGEIADNITDSLKFDDAHCESPRLEHIQNGTCVLVHEGDGDEGIVRSVGIQPEGVEVGHHEMIMGTGP